MKINEVREKLTKLTQCASDALPHIRVGMGSPCGKHPADYCGACWADAFYGSLSKAIEEMKRIYTERWEVEA